MTEVLPPSLVAYKPTAREKEITDYWFEKADTSSLGVLTGSLAVPFFSLSLPALPSSQLGAIWETCDPENTGFLTKGRFGVACRLMGRCGVEGGEEVRENWVGEAGPLPTFTGYTLPAHLQASRSPPQPLQPQATGGFTAGLSGVGQAGKAGTSITQEEKTRYAKLFMGSGPTNGLLDGDKARDIFIKSKLPYETLGKIWNLADTHSRGSLDVADFTIGMHLIQHTMNNDLPSLPAVLPPALYASAANLPPPSNMPSSPSMAPRSRMGPTSPLRQGSMSAAPVSPMGSRFISPQSTGQQAFAPNYGQSPPWDIDAKEKAESDGYFEGLDTGRAGSIEGEAAVGFFGQSGLPIDVLAKVWDLADVRGSGALNKDEFAVALRLIRDKAAGKELPQVLPLSMTPPSLRQGSVVSAPQRDLLDLMGDEPSNYTSAAPPSVPIFPQSTGGPSRLASQPTGSSFSQSTLQGTIFPQATGASARSASTLTPQTTGFGTNFVPDQAPSRSASNFFDDNDDADQNAKLSTDKATLGNLQQEHSTTSASVASLATKRNELEASLSATTSAINELHVKLSQARAAHETERGMVDNLEGRQKEQADLLARARHELITAESDLSALRVERTEIEGTYLRDKEDVRDMKKKMSEIATETSQLKETLEKLKKDARQQKGLVAISKKQLSTAEGEKERLAKDIVEEKERPVEIAEEPSPFDHVSSTREATGATSPFDHTPLVNPATVPQPHAIPLPMSPPIASPTGSTRSTNPFDRMGSLTAAITPEATGSSSASPSSPLATVAAVGLGAVASIGGVLGLSAAKHDVEEEKDEPIAQEPVSEADPFGVPTQTVATGSQPESNFDDGFGDDFSKSSAPATSATVPSSDFDDAFASMEPSTSAAPNFPAPVETPNPQIHSQVPTHSEKQTETSEEERHDEEEEASSDEEEGVEDATAGHHRSSTRDLSEASTGFETAKSDSGESFVHVPSGEEEAESKYPALEAVEQPATVAAPESTSIAHTSTDVLSGNRSASPVPDLGTFGDVAHSEEPTLLTRSVEPVPFLASSQSSTDTASPTTKKRAAPPPPPGRSALGSSSTSSSIPAFDDAFAATPFTHQASSDDFDDAFSDLPPPSTVHPGAGANAPKTDDFDTFDDDFAFQPEFDAPKAGTQSSSAFDDSFADFDSAFEPAPSSTPKGLSAVAPISTSSSSAFDDAFGTSGPPAAAGLPGYLDPRSTLAPNLPARPALTPAMDDDVDGVKQIVAMGFSRNQSLEALERYDYNVERALNSLLG